MLAELFNHAFNAQVSYNIAVYLQYVVYQSRQLYLFLVRYRAAV